jgi:hypothetical protein
MVTTAPGAAPLSLDPPSLQFFWRKGDAFPSVQEVAVTNSAGLVKGKPVEVDPVRVWDKQFGETGIRCRTRKSSIETLFLLIQVMPSAEDLAAGVHQRKLLLTSNGKTVALPVQITVAPDPTEVAPKRAAVPELASGVRATEVAKGTVDAYVVFVEFDGTADTGATGTPEEIVDLKNRMMGNDDRLVKALAEQSYGNLKLNIKWGPKWLPMPKPVTTYVPEKAAWDYKRFIQDAVGLVPPSETPQIVVAAVPNTPKFIRSSAAHKILVGNIQREINVGVSNYEEHYTTLMHELGHCFGLVDLYPSQAQSKHKVGPWDVMGDIQYATGFLAWNRRVFGWLNDDRIVYLKGGEKWDGEIAATSTTEGICMVAVRSKDDTGDAPKALYIVQVAPEVRGRDDIVLSHEGVGLLVYKVSAEGENDQKPLEVISNLENKATDSSKGLITSAPFPVGAFYERKDLPFTFNVTHRTGTKHTVEIRVA